jgi:TolB-like protein/class 3 adenylate cyclase/Flp pilus assembly protein TadD
MTTTRRLAAIMAVDVVGYSKLMGEDEAGTARAVSDHRDAARPIVASLGGRIVKTMGDGLLLEFPSVVAAVECAIAIQKLLAERNTHVPDARRIVYRIGVNLGDVLIDGDDILGEGVNIAARLEGICEPGGVLISSAAYDQTRGKIDAEFVDLGEKALKNIARSVRAYAVKVGSENPASSSSASDPNNHGPPRLSMVVLPFANIGGGADQDYFVDGVTESLTTDLSRIRGSFVIGRNTAFTYKGKAVDLKLIGRELNVRYVLEGSVQRAGNRIRVNVQLIDADTGSHLWAERFDKPVADLFDMQDEIVARLGNSLEAELHSAEARKSARKPNPDSMDFYFQGRLWQNRGATNENLQNARQFYETALALDEENVDALSGLAHVEITTIANYLNTADRIIHLTKAANLASKAVSIAPGHARAHAAWGLALNYSGRAVQGIAKCLRALELDPNTPYAHSAIGLGKIFVGRCEETEGHIMQALRLSPKDPGAAVWVCIVGHTKVHLQKYEEAVSWLERGIEMNPRYSLARFYYAVALVALGRVEEARDEVKIGLSLDPQFSIARFRASASGADPTYLSQRDHIYEGMRRAGVAEQ